MWCLLECQRVPENARGAVIGLALTKGTLRCSATLGSLGRNLPCCRELQIDLASGSWRKPTKGMQQTTLPYQEAYCIWVAILCSIHQCSYAEEIDPCAARVSATVRRNLFKFGTHTVHSFSPIL